MIQSSVFPKKRVKVSKIQTDFSHRFQGHFHFDSYGLHSMESVHHGLSDDPVEIRNLRTFLILTLY